MIEEVISMASDKKHDFYEASTSLPSRSEFHGKKTKKRKNIRNENSTQKKKSFKVSIPLVLVIILLLLPASFLIYYINNEKPSNAETVNRGGEQISFHEDEDEREGIVEGDDKGQEDVSLDTDNELENLEEVNDNENIIETPSTNEMNNQDTQPENVKDEEQVPEEPKENENMNQIEQEEKISKEEQTIPEQTSTEEPVKEEQTYIFHTVQKGDTLFSIAMKYFNSQTGMEIIQNENGLEGIEVKIGQTLKIPQS